MKTTVRARRFAAVIVAGMVLSFVAGCDRTKDDADEPTPVELPEGAVVYEADFTGDELGEEWETGYDGWEVDDGAVRVQGAHNDALWLQQPLPEKFRVSFRAQSDSEEGDIKFEILGDGATHESGYVGIYGGWDNRLNIIARLDEHGDDRLVGAEDMRVEPGRTYRMDVVRTDNRLRWYVDEQPFLTYEDDDPLRGDEHRYFGFNNWESSLTFDDLRIYDLSRQPGEGDESEEQEPEESPEPEPTQEEHDTASFEPVEVEGDVRDFVSIECTIRETELAASQRFVDGLQTLDDVGYRVDSDFADDGYEVLDTIEFTHEPSVTREEDAWFDDDDRFLGACPQLVAAFRSKAIGVEDTTSGADLWELRFQSESAAEKFVEHVAEFFWRKHPVAASRVGHSVLVVEGRHRERAVKQRLLDHFDELADR